MTPEATPPAIAGLIMLGAFVLLAFIVAAWQTFQYDFREPIRPQDEPWNRNTTALTLATTREPDPAIEMDNPLELLTEGNDA